MPPSWPLPPRHAGPLRRNTDTEPSERYRRAARGQETEPFFVGSAILHSAFHQEGCGHTENPSECLFGVFESCLSPALSLKSASKQSWVGICTGEAPRPHAPSPAESSRAGTALCHIPSSPVRAPETGLETTRGSETRSTSKGQGPALRARGTGGPGAGEAEPIPRGPDAAGPRL